jgi:hypothetical protein
MELRQVPLLGLGTVGKSVNVCAQERVNLFAEIHRDPEAGSKLTLFPTPGLTRFVDLGATPARGMYVRGDSMYVVAGLTLWEVAADGTTTSRGILQPTSGRVDITDNGLQMLIVDGTYGYIYTFATNNFAQIADADFPEAQTCAFLNGYFVVQETDSGRFYLSALYDGTSWDALDYATAESDPDNLVRLMVDNGMLVLFGDKTTEFWGDAGADDFPLARIGASAIEWGLAARWSLCKYMDSLIFLRKNRLGAVQVCVLAGSTAIPVSTSEMDYLFSTYTAENATAFTYMVSGHPMYQITFPSDNVTWVYDGLSKEWHRAQSGTSGRHRAEIQVNFQDQSYVSDYENGKVYLLDQDTFTDNGETIVREFTSRHLKTADYSTLPQLWIDMEGGVGLQTGQGSDPQVMLQISRDGGHTWGAELWRSFGAVGKYKARAIWNRLGRARDWTFRVRVTDPVKTVFVGAWGRMVK